MKRKKILLMYISTSSGHHQAAVALEKALEILDPSVEILNVNSLNYTNPLVERVINRTYMGVIKNSPEVWEYLYDNPKVFRNISKLRDLIHRFNSGKLKALLDDFKPDAIACTQAFPCGMVADYKSSYCLDVPLFGVLTDYAPHSYWIFDSVNYYIVHSETAMDKLVENGIPKERVRIFGIPIDPGFINEKNVNEIINAIGIDKNIPTVLIMGGGQGLGPIPEIVSSLNKMNRPIQMLIVAGTNERLSRWLEKRKRYFKMASFVYGYVSNIDELMAVATLIITKPGGLTISEAMAKSLPMIIIHPIPGQEAKNTEYLLKEGAAIRADSAKDVGVLTEALLNQPAKLEQMRRNSKRIAKPNSANEIAKLILECANL